jgi:predicted helicase
MDKLIDEYLRGIRSEFTTGKATEHSYRPSLKKFIETFEKGVKAINEPKQEECGAPDFIIQKKQAPIGYIECKDVKWALDPTEKTEQVKRYLTSLNNFILTNNLEFRYYAQGERKMTVPVAWIEKGVIRKIVGCEENLQLLLDAFMGYKGPTIRTPKDLAERMAKLAQLIRHTLKTAFEKEDDKGQLHKQFDGFKKVLLNELTHEQFADMYAQTICYGLFAARCNVTGKDADTFSRQHAAYDLPPTNPFLREIFQQIAGPALDTSIAWVVDDLAELLGKADIDAILKDFGKASIQKDPVVHFYETFLAEYDPKMRKGRGVYYTPEPVVSYIVRSMDQILKDDFGLKDGIADATMIEYECINPDTGKKEIKRVHKVQILDPAVGTGTFLHGVISLIHERFVEKRGKGMWSDYVTKHLLPRMYGFEILMAPYAVAHVKLSLLLKETGYDFKSDERLNVFLTNTLEPAHPHVIEMFANQLAQEANRASEIKKDVPVMVILGNPPYSGHSANKGAWIKDLMRGLDNTTGKKTSNYFETGGKKLVERNPKWLNDDYVKFIRFAQHKIAQTGYGILAFISNHGYIDNPTFRGMRESLLTEFDDIYIVDLHGNSKKKETCPDGSKDENVFDIQQGVAVGIFTKHQVKSKKTRIKHAHCYGLQNGKYEWLLENDVKSTTWSTLKPSPQYYLFTPQDNTLLNEYTNGWKISDVMPVNSVGIVTARDKLTVKWSKEEVWETVSDFVKLSPENAREKYDLGDDARDWKVSLAQEDLKKNKLSKDRIKPILYRPFDIRYTYYTGQTRGFLCMPRPEIMRHILHGDNLGLIFHRREELQIDYSHIFCTSYIVEHGSLSTKTTNSIAPLYLYPDPKNNGDLFSNGFARHVNLDSKFIEEISEKLSLAFNPDYQGDLKKTFGPENVFHYIYAILHSPTYRARYAEFLKMDFPRIPITTNIALFRKLCVHGKELVGLHLLERAPEPFSAYPIAGNDIVEKVWFEEPKKGKEAHTGRVFINKTQFFETVPPEVWFFHIGGYQVCHKWLKDRKDRKLSYDDKEHYMKIVVVLNETIRIMAEIDKAIPQWPIV